MTLIPFLLLLIAGAALGFFVGVIVYDDNNWVAFLCVIGCLYLIFRLALEFNIV